MDAETKSGEPVLVGGPPEPGVYGGLTVSQGRALCGVFWTVAFCEWLCNGRAAAFADAAFACLALVALAWGTRDDEDGS